MAFYAQSTITVILGWVWQEKKLKKKRKKKKRKEKKRLKKKGKKKKREEVTLKEEKFFTDLADGSHHVVLCWVIETGMPKGWLGSDSALR